MTGPFSACIIVIIPVSAETCMAFRICASSDMKTPGYAMKSLKLEIPSSGSLRIAASESSLTSPMI